MVGFLFFVDLGLVDSDGCIWMMLQYMIFKVHNKYWQQVQNYLITNYPTTHKILPNPSESHTQFQLTCQDSHPNIAHTFALKLLSEYNHIINNNKQSSNLTIGQFLKGLLGKLQDMGIGEGEGEREGEREGEKQVVCESLGMLLAVEDFRRVKGRVGEKKDQLVRKLDEVGKCRAQFQQAVVDEQNKLAEGVRNVSLKLKILETQQPSDNSELTRVQNLIKNGVWGYLPQIQQKMQQIRKLEQQIRLAKQQQPQN